MLRSALITLSDGGYRVARPLIFRSSAQTAHEQALDVLRRFDDFDYAQIIMQAMHRAAFRRQPVRTGTLMLPYPLMLAAGFVKGSGFASENEACAAVLRGQNIIPGWRTMPALVGLVEFGSFTRWPRIGNPGIVLWRDVPNRSTQNRVGLKNPGARAAAAFLARHRAKLPPMFGINIAVSPGVDDLVQAQQEVEEAFGFFLSQGILPTWFTLNISCPNTEDDPHGHQTEAHTRQLCATVSTRLQGRVPLWVKVSPGLAPEQYQILMRVFEETGVSAVIATNTLAQPAPGQPGVIAGVGGARLHLAALETATLLMREKAKHGYTVDIIGCGGVQDGLTYREYHRAGVQAIQDWSALLYRGPLAAAILANEANTYV